MQSKPCCDLSLQDLVVAGRIHHLRVSLVDGGLVLEGHASTYYAKQVAQHLAMQLSGLPIQANNIEVI